MKNDIYLSIIVPVYNEETKIQKDLDSIFSYLKNKKEKYEIIFVDDGSLDNTKNIINEYKNSFTELKLISYFPNRGKGFAIKTGILQANGTYILFADAGLCVPYDNLEIGIELLKNGYDFALGSRALSSSQVLVSQPSYRKIGSRLFSMIIKYMMGISEIKDTQCGFKLFKQNEAKKIFNLNRIERFMFDAETIINAQKLGYKMKEFPVEWSNDPDSRFNPIKGTIKNFKELLWIKFNLK